MGTRDRLSEILEIKQRGRRNHTHLQFMSRDLLRQWNASRNDKGCTPEFYPVRAVTLIEASTRAWIAQLIDAGSPYVENAVNLCKNVKFDLDLVRAIESRVITLGDLVAHTVSVNNLDQIISHYEVLLGRPVLPILESTIDRWAVEVEGNDAAPIIRDVQEVCRQLAALFVTRHISVHEVAARPALNVQDVEGYLKATDDFIAATEWALQDLLYGKTPLTQGAMTAEAWSKFRAVDTDLELLLGELRVRIGSDQVRLNLLEESHRRRVSSTLRHPA